MLRPLALYTHTLTEHLVMIILMDKAPLFIYNNLPFSRQNTFLPCWLMGTGRRTFSRASCPTPTVSTDGRMGWWLSCVLRSSDGVWTDVGRKVEQNL